MAAELEFKKCLYKISSHFSRSEVDKLKFILSDFIPRRKLERAASAFHVFCLLESHDALLNRNDLSFFKEILDEVHKGHYIEQYLSVAHPSGLPLATARVVPDKQLTSFLASLADDLTNENVRDVGLFFSGDTVKLEDVESIQDGVLLFARLKDAGVNLGQIKDVLSVLRRKDLATKIDSFLAAGSHFSPPGLGQDLKSPEMDAGNTHLKRGVQERGDQEESMETESSSTNSTAYYTSLSGSSMVTSPTHSSSGSMVSTTPSTMEMDIGGRGRTVLFIGGKVNKEVTTEQLSIAVEERGEKLTRLEKAVVGIQDEKSHTADAERIKELEGLLSNKVKEVETQMEETKKLREALNSRDDVPIYTMTSKPHGLAVIFVNGKFDKNPKAPKIVLNNRAGAAKDEEHFVLTFKFLGYEIVVHRNLSSAEMYAKMEGLNNVDHSNYDSLVVCVSSHGNQRSIYGSDSVEVKRNEFCNSIKTCPSLKGKPKLFFIQACRLPVVDADAHGEGQEEETTPMDTPLHPDADILVANSSTPDNAAYISPDQGSWFVTSLKRKLTDPAMTYGRTLHQILQEVNREVCQQQGMTKNEGETVNQCVEVSTRLRKGVKFFQK